MQLTVDPVNERNYAGQECCFELKIPYAKADTVQASIPDLPAGVNFVSMRRSDYSEDEAGTKIELWLNFSEPGNYKIRVMRITVSGKIYPIKFSPVTISENPKDIMPQLVIQFDNGTSLVQTRRSRPISRPVFSVPAGTNVGFTVNLQYAVQLASFYWSVPKDSIFTETSRYDITRGNQRSSEFSEELLPIASFDWQPLVPGNMPLPSMQFFATSYNGTRVELELPDAFINVTEGLPQSGEEKNWERLRLFSNAFESLPSMERTGVQTKVSRGDCEMIASLRGRERRSLPFGRATAERKNFENSVGISAEDPEPKYFGLYFFSALTLLSLVLIFIFFMLKKVSGMIFSSTLAIVFAVFSIIYMIHLNTRTAIFTGGKISPVPERQVEAVESISGGKRVFIEQKAGGWLYIRYGSSCGWTDFENVIPIE